MSHSDTWGCIHYEDIIPLIKSSSFSINSGATFRTRREKTFHFSHEYHIYPLRLAVIKACIFSSTDIVSSLYYSSWTSSSKVVPVGSGNCMSSTQYMSFNPIVLGDMITFGIISYAYFISSDQMSPLFKDHTWSSVCADPPVPSNLPLSVGFTGG